MKVIDLLNKMANNEEMPKKIRYGSYIMIYNIDENDYRTPEQDYYDCDVKTYKWFTDCIDISTSLNDEIEIIEEKPKKIEEIDDDNSIWEEQAKDIDYIFKNKIDELTKAVNYLLEKESDK